MGRLCHQSRVTDLRGLEDLAGDRTVCIAYQERTAAGFAGILYHAANTDRTIQFSPLFVTQIRILQRFKNTLLLRYQHTGKDLFVANCIFLQPVRHYIIDILDKYDVRILLVKVFNQSTVTSRAEEQLTIFRAERRTVRISCDRVRTR